MAIFDPKTKVISGYQKSIEEKNRVIAKYFDQIGRLYYGQYKDMSVDVTKDINTRCEAVSDLYDEIRDCELKILFAKGLKLCPNCGKENMLAYAFCFACGAKFEPGSENAPGEVKPSKVEPIIEAPAIEEPKAEEPSVEEVKEEEKEETSEEVVEETSEEAAEETSEPEKTEGSEE